MLDLEYAAKETSFMRQVRLIYPRYNILILLLLAQKPMTGYEIMAHITNIWMGLLQPGPSTIYPKLKEMQEAGLIEGIEEYRGNKRVVIYRLTGKGKSILKAVFPLAYRIGNTVMALMEEAEKRLEDVEPDPVARRIINRMLHEHQ